MKLFERRELTLAEWIGLIVMMTGIYLSQHGWPF